MTRRGYDALAQLSAVLAGAEGLDDVLELAAGHALELLEATECSISRWDRAEGQLVTLVNAGELLPGEQHRPDSERYRVSDFPVIVGFDVEDLGVLTRLEDESADPAQRGLLAGTGRASSISLPIVVDGRAWGELYATRDAALEPFGEEDLPFARAVAAVLAAWIAQADRLSLARRMAYEDPLTGLANRRAVDSRLDALIGSAVTTHAPGPDSSPRHVALLVCDLNGLKAYNDGFGHDAGDSALLAVAAALSSASAAVPGSLAARIGGDEFCIVVPDHPPGACVRLADDLAARAEELLPAGMSLASGLACTGEMVGPTVTASVLFRLADAAQYRAKRAGSRVPVVAGRRGEERSPDTDAQSRDGEGAAGLHAVVPVPDLLGLAQVPAPPNGDRRHLRGRGRLVAGRVISRVLAQLAELGQADLLARLSVVGAAVADEVDAAGWWVSSELPGLGLLEVQSFQVARDPRALVVAVEEPGEVGDQYPLADFPWTAAALEGGYWTALVGEPGTDPAEDAFLVAGGFVGAVAAGLRVEGRGWLVEVYADDLSGPLDGAAEVLWVLTAAAALTRAH